MQCMIKGMKPHVTNDAEAIEWEQSSWAIDDASAEHANGKKKPTQLRCRCGSYINPKDDFFDLDLVGLGFRDVGVRV